MQCLSAIPQLDAAQSYACGVTTKIAFACEHPTSPLMPEGFHAGLRLPGRLCAESNPPWSSCCPQSGVEGPVAPSCASGSRTSLLLRISPLVRNLGLCFAQLDSLRIGRPRERVYIGYRAAQHTEKWPALLLLLWLLAMLPCAAPRRAAGSQLTACPACA